MKPLFTAGFVAVVRKPRSWNREGRAIGTVVPELALEVEPRERIELHVDVAKETVAAVVTLREFEAVDRVVVLQPLVERIGADVQPVERITREQVHIRRHARQPEEAVAAILVQTVLTHAAVKRVQTRRSTSA